MSLSTLQTEEIEVPAKDGGSTNIPWQLCYGKYNNNLNLNKSGKEFVCIFFYSEKLKPIQYVKIC